MENTLRVIHTSDWHIGHILHEKKRYDEFEQFFEWLNEQIENFKPDILLVSGDIFHTASPSPIAQSIYYNFLASAEKHGCKNVVITGGNHDSPTLLDAPKELLKQMNVFVCGAVTDNVNDEVFVIKNNEGQEIAIVCAVPFLREKDLRNAYVGETTEEKEKRLKEGFKNHYLKVSEKAKELNKNNLPVIAMGHLYAAGAESSSEDELQIGSLSQVGADIFPEYFDYVALGHLHIPQKINNNERIRYSGSPLPISFDEVNNKKEIILLEFNNKDLDIKHLEVPKFRKIIRLKGTLQELLNKLEEQKSSDCPVWVDLTITSGEAIQTITNSIDDCIKDSNIEVLAKHPYIENDLAVTYETRDFAKLTPLDVFNQLLKNGKKKFDEDAEKELLETFSEACLHYKDEDEE